MFFKTLTVLCSILITVNSARILIALPVPSFSHQVFFRPIWKQLAQRGHDLTLLTTDPMEDTPNIRQIDWSFSYDLRHRKYNITKVLQENEYNLPKIIKVFSDMYCDINNQELLHPDMQILLKNESEYFDLLIVEFHTPLMFALSYRFNCPFIGVSSADISNLYHGLLGNPVHPVLYPELFFSFGRKLRFIERVFSTLAAVYFNFLAERWEVVEVSRKHFGPNVPPLMEIANNVSMVFINTHPVFNRRPLGPGFVTIGGGTHLEPLKPLPKDIQNYLDNAKTGVIYFSLGTNVRSNHVSDELKQIFVETFKELPYEILWKFEIDVKNASKNVKIVRWAPQQDVLRHKNVKLFITQCGAQSLEEGILSHVNMIGIPFVADQKMNSHRLITHNIGISLDKKTITKEQFKSAILEVINNPSYKKNIKKLATLLQDEPMSGVEKAVWWTEFVIRHQGASHFWNPNRNIPFYQYLLLDVLLFVLAILTVLSFIVFKIIRLFYKKIYIMIGKQKVQ